jgi:hypothetical protein
LSVSGLLEARIAFLFAQDLHDGHRQIRAEVAAAFGDHEDVVDRIANVDRVDVGAQSSCRLRLTGPDHELHRESAHDGRHVAHCRRGLRKNVVGQHVVRARPAGRDVERAVARRAPQANAVRRIVEAGVLRRHADPGVALPQVELLFVQPQHVGVVAVGDIAPLDDNHPVELVRGGRPPDQQRERYGLPLVAIAAVEVIGTVV